MATSVLLAHLGLHGDDPLGGLAADLVFLAGPALLVAAAWLLVRRTGR